LTYRGLRLARVVTSVNVCLCVLTADDYYGGRGGGNYGGEFISYTLTQLSVR